MKHTLTILCLVLLALCVGCTVISYDRAFPKLTWYWSKEAQNQRAEQKQEKQWEESQRTNSPTK